MGVALPRHCSFQIQAGAVVLLAPRGGANSTLTRSPKRGARGAPKGDAKERRANQPACRVASGIAGGSLKYSAFITADAFSDRSQYRLVMGLPHHLMIEALAPNCSAPSARTFGFAQDRHPRSGRP
jgi:hypothetical protein